MLEALPFMHYGLVFTARLLKMAMTRWHLLLHPALLCLREQSHMLHLPTTPVYTHDEAAGGDKHQQTKGDGRYEAYGFHDNGYKDNVFFNMVNTPLCLPAESASGGEGGRLKLLHPLPYIPSFL